MANEINMSATLTSSKSGLTITGYGQKYVDQAGSEMIASIQNIGTNTEAIAIGDITNIGKLFVKNLSETDNILLGLNTPVVAGDAFATLLPGEFCMVPTRQEVIYGIGAGTGCLCEVVAISV